MVKKISGFRFLIYIMLMVIPMMLISPSCKSKMSKREREIQKEKEKRRKDDTVLYQKALKKHMKNQGKDTQKMMKRNAKEAQRYNDQKEEFFLKRWFKKSNHKRKTRHRG